MNIRIGILTAPKIDFEQREQTFILHNVRIGIGFHWDRCEDQEFAGKLEILHNTDGTETAVNVIDLEDYLCSVISSEMSANSPIELLKAHAVISRSWAIRAIEANKKHTYRTSARNNFESNGHIGFDVCADDHCQRYEGLARMNEHAVEAVRATAGQVLMFDNVICDCRFHKCCGGKTEEFETCWEDIHIPYLESVECPYCAPNRLKNNNLLKQSLNDYDLETADYHDWRVDYSSSELGDIIRKKSGIDFGNILDLIPLKRGKSGRIYELNIIGTKQSRIIGKELTIRRWLSPTCLYSSWFDIEKIAPCQLPTDQTVSTDTSKPNRDWHFRLFGHGWGHGVGLCQIGAATMAAEGWTYEQILSHYYHGATLTRACVPN